MTKPAISDALPQPIVVSVKADALDDLLSKEWLLSNRIGAYASSTVLGCNARRYHGLLVAATAPPVGRINTLTTVMERLSVGGGDYELATNEFAGTLAPRGFMHLAEFRNDVAATWVYRAGGVELIKQVMIAEASNAVAIRYTLHGARARLAVSPFLAMRDFHHLRRIDQPHQMMFETAPDGIIVQDRMRPIPAMHLTSREASFEPAQQWWYKFYYRIDIARGQDGFEDLYTPGTFFYELGDGESCQLTAALGDPHPLGFETTTQRRSERLAKLAESVSASDVTTRRLAVATDAFVVQRAFPHAAPSATILAGYHWFADWGRDTFIALPGLLLSTGRHDVARQVFETFIRHIADGLVPNRFDDYSTNAHYNSIDASLWFVLAAERYMQATNDTSFWRGELMRAIDQILTAFHNGTQFYIRADSDGLLTGGSQQTQLTWMDAKLGDEVVTPRHGKPVEVNALWYCAHRVMQHRCRGIDDARSKHYGDLADAMQPEFVRQFWNPYMNCLNDCVADWGPDGTVRPNQIIAVAVPHSPLDRDKQAAVVKTCRDKLLTPMGLRTLSSDDGRYRRAYGGSWESRDRAYHQGTVWAWLIGPFIEAYLRVEGNKPPAIQQARQWLVGFDKHLEQAGLGYVSEIFDGEPPHAPRGCIAQAWSVAEVLRVKLMLDELEGKRTGK